MRLKTTFLSLFLIACFQQIYAQGCGADFQDVNGIAVIELDSKTAGAWERRSDAGSSGGQALYYNGGNTFNSPPGNSVINYTVRINTAGEYRIMVRNRIGITNAGTTEHNDMWLKVSGGNSTFFGRLGSGVVWPIGSGRTPNPEGASGNGYLKVYTNTFGWNWTSFTDDSGGHNIFANFPSPGVYTIQVGGRSNGFLVDKLAMFRTGAGIAASTAQNAGSTACDGSTPPPPPPPPPADNVAPTVNITSPGNGQNFAAGSNIEVNLSSNDSDGSIVTHQISINGTVVDTDGGTYTPHQINNAQPGSYTILATVTDNSGATATSTVSITVDEGDDTTDDDDDDMPPPPPPPAGNNAPTVSITSPSSGQNFSSGSNVSVALATSDSDGSVVKHEIFVNGALVDTDGPSYTPHIIGNIAAGSYTIMATVTDNGGATASSSVSITVDGSDDDTTPPPPPPTPTDNAVPTVSFTELSNGDQVAPGSTVFVKIAASDSDGTIVKYQVWVNGLLVDTDGANYTPHPITGITSGDYEIKVEVTDNVGATASTTVNITAGTGTPPPTGSDITFDLINAVSDGVIGELVDGATISSSKTQKVNIRVNAPSNTVRLGAEIYRDGTLDDQRFESFLPYAVYGDTEGDYNETNLLNGSYRLVAAAYSSTGQIIAIKTIMFTVGSESGKSAFLFPNPVLSDGKVSVRLPEGSSGKFQYSISNSLGIQVERGTFDAKSSQRDVQLSLPNIGRQVQGVYYMTLRSNGSRETIPLIRE